MSEPSPLSAFEPPGDLYPPDNPISREWAVFCRELPRLLTEGHEGRWVLIKGDEIVGLFDSRQEAMEIGTRKFGLAPMLASQILRHYKPVRAGNSWRCLP